MPFLVDVGINFHRIILEPHSDLRAGKFQTAADQVKSSIIEGGYPTMTQRRSGNVTLVVIDGSLKNQTKNFIYMYQDGMNLIKRA